MLSFKPDGCPDPLCPSQPSLTVRSLPMSSLKVVIVSLHQLIFCASECWRSDKMTPLTHHFFSSPILLQAANIYVCSQPTVCYVTGCLSPSQDTHVHGLLNHINASSVLDPSIESSLANDGKSNTVSQKRQKAYSVPLLFPSLSCKFLTRCIILDLLHECISLGASS